MVTLLVVAFAVLLTITAPLAIAMGLGSVLALWTDGSVPLFILVQRMFGGIDSYVLLAIPFYILAGNLMESAGISERLVNLARACVGHIRGSIGMVTVVAEYFFSGISGSTTADVSAIGTLLIPAMRRAGYSAKHAVAIVAAATSMGALVPPSVGMIVLAAIMEISVGALFLSGFLPAAVIAVVIMLLIYRQARRSGLPIDTRASLRQLVSALKDASLALLMPIIIFGGIFSGLTSATEAGAIACWYALVVGMLIYHAITPRDLVQIVIKTGLLTGAVMFLVSTATIFSWILTVQQVPQRLGALAFSLSSARWIFLAIVVLVFMVLGGLLEGIPAMIILVPIFAPLAKQMGLHPLHFALLAYTAISVGLFLPPFGIGLLLSSALGGITIEEATPAFMPYLVALGVGLGLVAAIPWLTLVLPSLFGMSIGG
jgi:tripartite ATP-independent transporter DctM subunit